MTVVASLLTLSACGNGPASEPPPPPPTSSVPNTEEITVSGAVMSGVEPGCLLLDTGTTQYLLVGTETQGLRPGQQLTVTGTPERGTPTTCMQGIPLRVKQAQPPTTGTT
nr:hypothetical protein [Kibdelosporangium sp. MJ126-NF4]CTQ91208.1 hypothetical protein [Kibdelosporangium sp. MJ126-NF4]